MEALLALAEELGLTVVEKRSAHTSGYRPGDSHIFLTPKMPRRTARSVLAHEIAHHVLGHSPAPFGPLRKRQERAANEWAALYLIRLDAYVEVERLRDGHLTSMAHDLDVAPELVAAFQDVLARKSSTARLDRYA